MNKQNKKFVEKLAKKLMSSVDYAVNKDHPFGTRDLGIILNQELAGLFADKERLKAALQIAANYVSNDSEEPGTMHRFGDTVAYQLAMVEDE